MMTLRSKIILKHNLSTETVESIKNYLREFLSQKHAIEYFDGQVSIYLHEPDDARLLREQFPSLIARVERV